MNLPKKCFAGISSRHTSLETRTSEIVFIVVVKTFFKLYVFRKTQQTYFLNNLIAVCSFENESLLSLSKLSKMKCHLIIRPNAFGLNFQ